MTVAVSKKSPLALLRTIYRLQRDEATRAKYENNLILWIEERAKGYMWSVPRKICQSVMDNRRTAVQAHHSLGKSWLSARIAAWWIDSHPPGTAFVVTTAPSSKQVKTVLWKEIRRAFYAAGLRGRLNQTEWWLNEEMVAMGRKPSDYDPTAFQGIHAKYVLVIYDEACGIPENIFIAGNSLAANQYSKLLAIGNPDDPDSHFKKICEPGSGWNVIQVSAFDTPNFTGEYVPQEVADVLVSHIFVDEMKHDVGEDSPVYISKVLGQFPENKADGVIPLSWLRNCQDEDEYEARFDKPAQMLPVEIGMDVGAGGDETSLRVRFGKFAGEFVEAKTPKSQQAYELAVRFIMKHKATRIKVDNIGVGFGVVGLIEVAIQRSQIGTIIDGVRHTGYFDETIQDWVDISYCEVAPVNVGMRATDPEKFPRLRDQIWWEVGRGLSQDQGWNLTEVDDVTISQLTAPTWERDTSNRHSIESKTATMKRTNKPSPNKADALLLAFTEPPRLEEESSIVTIYEPVVIGPDI